MLVIHALWSLQQSLMIWAEDPALAKRVRTYGRSATSWPPQPHPFAIPARQLRRMLPEILGHVEGLHSAEATLILPSRDSRPVSSLDMDMSTQTPVQLQTWHVETCVVPTESAFRALLAPRQRIPTNVTEGQSWRFCSTVAQLCLDMIARGQVLPARTRQVTLEERARWLPSTPLRDKPEWQALIKGMPGMCRADLARLSLLELDHLRQSRWQDVKGVMPEQLLEEMFSTLVDVGVRDALHVQPPTTTQSGLHRRLNLKMLRGEVLREALTLSHPRQRVEAEAAAAEADALALLNDVADTEWQSTPAVHERTFRTSFKLTEPSEDEEGDEALWMLEFLLQASDDETIQIPAPLIWTQPDTLFSVHGYSQDHPQEQLLRDLGRAARHFEPLQRALESPYPVAFDLTTEEAYQFLNTALEPLEKEGFGVMTPSWWRKERAAMGLQLCALAGDDSQPASASPQRDGLCAFEWRISVDGLSLSLESLKALATQSTTLVRHDGRWLELRRGDVERVMHFFEEHEAHGVTPTMAALRMGLGLDVPEGIDVVDFAPNGALGELLEGDKTPDHVATPDAFKGTLRPYQERGLAWLVFLSRLGLGACLADDMGLGKTIQLLALLLHERDVNPATNPTLLVCPLSVVNNWAREAFKFAPTLRVMVHHGPDRDRGEALRLRAMANDIVITTYGLIAREGPTFQEIEWHRVALDEAQNIKNRSAKQTRSVLELSAPQRVALTGTPVENRLSELHSIMDFLNPDLLGSAEAFKRTFALPIERDQNPRALALLKRLTRPFILRRLKTDRTIAPDLPDKVERRVDCFLTREQTTLYQRVVDDLLEQLSGSEGMQRRGMILGAMTRLKQVCDHPALFLQDGSDLTARRSGKLQTLEEVLENIFDLDERALCFTQFATMAKLLATHCKERFGVPVALLHGGVPKARRDAMVTRFQRGEGAGLFMISLKAGGTGLNLTAANHVIHFDRWWNPAVEDQATDRAFRIGQHRNVQVHKFVCVGTLEEKIDAMIERKKSLSEQVVSTGERWLTELSTAELKELISLARDVITEDE